MYAFTENQETYTLGFCYASQGDSFEMAINSNKKIFQLFLELQDQQLIEVPNYATNSGSFASVSSNIKQIKPS